jgi:sporulation integral membrane protein YlbJ
LTNKSQKTNILLITVLTALIISMVCAPATCFAAASQGLSLWWEVVVPALLPFFIISEILLELKVSRYLSRAMSPLMRPLFALPGSAALAVVLGFCSGFPSGAALTAALRREGAVSKTEGERLICFTNNSSLLYLTVAVAAGLFHCPAAALLLAIVHYGGNLMIGIILGAAARRRAAYQLAGNINPVVEPAEVAPPLTDFGRILKAAASRAAANIAVIGCLMAFFAVLTGMIGSLPLPDLPLLQGFYRGFWEMTLGVNALADSGLPLRQALPAAAALISFGGLSVQMQVLAMVGDTDIRIWPYLLSRLLHAAISYFGVALLYPLLSLPVVLAPAAVTGPAALPLLLSSLLACLIALGVLGLLSLLMLVWRYLRQYRRKS